MPKNSPQDNQKDHQQSDQKSDHQKTHQHNGGRFCAQHVGVAAGLGPRERLAALQLVREGLLFELDQPIQIGSPNYERVQPPYMMSLWTRAQNVIRSVRKQGVQNDPGVNLESVHMTFHVGTHIDALGHFTIGDQMYGGQSADALVGDLGLKGLGAETIPSLITRGVCLDLAGLDGGDCLASGRAISAQDLQNVAQAAGVRIGPGDVVLLRTGWSCHYLKDNKKYCAGEPGISLDAAQWLTGLGVVAIGSDNMAVEVIPSGQPGVIMPVHQHALVEKGVYLIENLYLDELARHAGTEFCFVLLPTRFKGATGSPARPVAMV